MINPLGCCAVKSCTNLLTALIVLMVESVITSETSVNIYQTRQRNIPEDGHLYTRRQESLKSHHIHTLRYRRFSCIVSLIINKCQTECLVYKSTQPKDTWHVSIFLSCKGFQSSQTLYFRRSTQIMSLSECRYFHCQCFTLPVHVADAEQSMFNYCVFLQYPSCNTVQPCG